MEPNRFEPTYSPEADLEHAAFQVTENPVHVWRAWALLRFLRDGPPEPIPAWVLYWFDGLVARLMLLQMRARVEGRVRNIERELLFAVGLKRRGKGRRLDALSQFMLTERDTKLAAAYHSEMMRNPSGGVLAARSKVAEDNGVSEKVVQRAWARWSALLSDATTT